MTSKLKGILFKLPYILAIFTLMISCQQKNKEEKSNNKELIKKVYRFATYNSSLNRSEAGKLIKELKSGESSQAENIAEIIQIVRPDVLSLQEFDFDEKGEAMQYFLKNFLSKGQNGEKPIDYPYVWVVPSNTGVETGVDFNNDKKIAAPEDAYGFGEFEGQYAFALLSKYPILWDSTKTFQKFLWKDMPNPHFPKDKNNEEYYSKKAIDIFRLSSKNHIDAPIKLVDGSIIHAIVAHPTPPVFDGPEDRNGKRNYDEIKFLSDYIKGDSSASYIVSDKGVQGGLNPNDRFVIMGDMNADPEAGDSYQKAILQFFDNSKINQQVTSGDFIPSSKGAIAYSKEHKLDSLGNNVNTRTSKWGMRVDYILPSYNIKVVDSGVFWPDSLKDFNYKMENTSDHMMVWTDIEISN
ncbi:endonuclease/exonuclease/phosphatase family protein [Aureibacter tunicatorum]|uniref:3-phytase n=1 Tax=Aureibacter tunicatorum TaxID=866807 RepID=A0AAE3XSI3_9BACT|nr:endonuclease/exonuclease/phosphatase family protein [Aureibacter tunicatorum]MDR6241715.1 3-phytase [Aureibacter tunicatorum]BDD07300.1 endonuclease [Aureibacter tunicatorum]